MLSINNALHYADCRHAECCILFIDMLSVIILNVFMLNAFMLSVMAPLLQLKMTHCRIRPKKF